VQARTILQKHAAQNLIDSAVAREARCDHRTWLALWEVESRMGLTTCFGSGGKESGGVVSDLEQQHRERDRKGNPPLFLSLGIGFVIAAILVIVTSGTAAAGLPFVIAAAGLLGKGLSDMRGQQRAVGPPVSTERELLSAIKANGGSITPAEAAMETSLTVREADGMLSELAGGGHLAVESRDGALFYSLPGRPNPELEGR
jgi:hypothetical protein